MGHADCASHVPGHHRLLGIGLVVEASLRVLLAAMLPSGLFLAVSPVLGGVIIGGLFAFTLWFGKRARRVAEERYAGLGLVYPSVPLDKGTAA